MILQNIIFPSTATCTIEDLFFRKKGLIDYDWSEKNIRLYKRASLNLNTYFNGFSIGKWKKYTKLESLFFALNFRGKVRVFLFQEERIGRDVYRKYLLETEVESEGGIKTFPFEGYSEKGILSLEIIAVENTTVYGGYFYTEIAETDRRNVKIALDICTYKREKFVLKNMDILKREIFAQDKYKTFRNSLEVFVVDNAGTLDERNFDGQRFYLIRNRNVGGSGGFTRGMIEIKARQKERNYTHALLMDDDVVIEPEALFRTWTLLSILKDKYAEAFVGGAMLRRDKPFIQVESGAFWNGGNLLSRKGGLDLRNAEACLFNEIEESVDYSAWWYSAVPLDIITDENLPLPLFIRGDDVEYGLRNAKTIVLMNGICVWHEPFENKYSSSIFYYIIRNRLIDNAVHGIALSKKDFIKELEHQVNLELYLCRYKNVHLLLQGVEDYLKGVDWMKAIDGENLHRKIIQEGYKFQSIEELGTIFDYGLYEQSFGEKERKSFFHRCIRKLTANGVLLKPRRPFCIIPVTRGRQTCAYRTALILNYDEASEKGFMTKREPDEAIACLQRLRKVKKGIAKRYDNMNREYQIRGKELMNIGFWEKYLNCNSYGGKERWN